MKKLMFFALMGIMLAAVSCGKDKDSSSGSGFDMDKANELVSKQYSLAKEMTAALQAGDETKQAEIKKQWIALINEVESMGEPSESQKKEIQEKWGSKFKEPDAKRGERYLSAYTSALYVAEEEGGTVLTFTEENDGSFNYRISTDPSNRYRSIRYN